MPDMGNTAVVTTFVLTNLDDYQYPIQPNYHRNDHPSASSRTPTRKNRTRDNKRISANQGPKIRALVTNQHATRRTMDLCNQKEDQPTKVGAEDDAILETSQISMNQGIRMFREAGVDAGKKELQQLHDRKVMKAQAP